MDNTGLNRAVLPQRYDHTAYQLTTKVVIELYMPHDKDGSSSSALSRFKPFQTSHSLALRAVGYG